MNQLETARLGTPRHEHGGGLPWRRLTPTGARRLFLQAFLYSVWESLGMTTRPATRNFCRGYPFRSQLEYRKEIRQADGTEPPNVATALPGSAVSVLKLEPGCGVTAILLESPAGGQGVHEVQSPAAARRAVLSRPGPCRAFALPRSAPCGCRVDRSSIKVISF
jgi:hypothetical protein